MKKHRINFFSIYSEEPDDLFPTFRGSSRLDKESIHTPKIVANRNNLFALIARSVGRHEMLNNPKAIEAMDKEWERLRTAGDLRKGAWREDLVEEWSDVCARYTALGKAVHVGDLLEVCVQKAAVR